MKKCPYCSEEIQDEAIVCRYCGRDLKKKGSIWAIAIPVGLVLATLIFLVSGSKPQTGSNATFHFVSNVFIWSLITAVLISLDRWLKSKGFRFFWGIIILGVVLFFLFSSTGANILSQSSQIKNFLESGITTEATPKAKHPAVVVTDKPKQTPHSFTTVYPTITPKKSGIDFNALAATYGRPMLSTPTVVSARSLTDCLEYGVVAYAITSTDNVIIRAAWKNDKGEWEKYLAVTPWCISYLEWNVKDEMYIYVQVTEPGDDDTVSCEIYHHGKKVAHNSQINYWDNIKCVYDP